MYFLMISGDGSEETTNGKRMKEEGAVWMYD